MSALLRVEDLRVRFRTMCSLKALAMGTARRGMRSVL